jgi:hypothetical protein
MNRIITVRARCYLQDILASGLRRSQSCKNFFLTDCIAVNFSFPAGTVRFQLLTCYVVRVP